MKDIIKYLRELSIIVVGIAITVLSGLWINQKNNEKDIELYFENIKMELQENLNDLNGLKYYYEKSANYSDYLMKNNMQNLHPDTLSEYNDLTMMHVFFTYKSSAFKMFETSGTMRLVKDKSKITSIWNCYDAFEFLKIINDFYIERKVSFVERIPGLTITNVSQELLFGFYANEMAENWAGLFAIHTKHIEETIAKL